MTETTLLAGIPALRYGDPSAVCFIGAVQRLLEALGETVGQDELFALSGVGLCFPWRCGSCCDEVGIIPEIPARTLGAFGYESAYLTGEALADKAAAAAKIRASIAAGRPVIGFGVTVSAPMACLIVGCGKDGLYVRACQPPEGGEAGQAEPYFVADWHEKCAGLLFAGEKTGERLTGEAAYARIADWAALFRGYDLPVTAAGQAVYVGQAAFGQMIGWLLDDAQWQSPNEGGKEMYLKQCGLLLFNHYRWQLGLYLRRLEDARPGTVPAETFELLGRIGAAVPGAHTSDLWLHEAVDGALTDFSAMRRREVREKAAAYVRRLSELDAALLWSLARPAAAQGTEALVCERFDYRRIGRLRFIGVDAWRTGESWDALRARRGAFLPALDALAPAYGAGMPGLCAMMHHNGGEVDSENHFLLGRFFRAGTPVPDGFDFYDLPTELAAYAVYAGESFDGDLWTGYYRTRDRILADGRRIPYPERYWHAEVYTDGMPRRGRYRFGYLFSVDE